MLREKKYSNLILVLAILLCMVFSLIIIIPTIASLVTRTSSVFPSFASSTGQTNISVDNSATSLPIDFSYGEHERNISFTYSSNYDIDVKIVLTLQYTDETLTTKNVILNFANRDEWFVGHSLNADGSEKEYEYVLYHLGALPASNNQKITVLTGVTFYDNTTLDESDYLGQKLKIDMSVDYCNSDNSLSYFASDINSNINSITTQMANINSVSYQYINSTFTNYSDTAIKEWYSYTTTIRNSFSSKRLMTSTYVSDNTRINDNTRQVLSTYLNIDNPMKYANENNLKYLSDTNIIENNNIVGNVSSGITIVADDGSGIQNEIASKRYYAGIGLLVVPTYESVDIDVTITPLLYYVNPNDSEDKGSIQPLSVDDISFEIDDNFIDTSAGVGYKYSSNKAFDKATYVTLIKSINIDNIAIDDLFETYVNSYLYISIQVTIKNAVNSVKMTSDNLKVYNSTDYQGALYMFSSMSGEYYYIDNSNSSNKNVTDYVYVSDYYGQVNSVTYTENAGLKFIPSLTKFYFYPLSSGGYVKFKGRYYYVGSSNSLTLSSGQVVDISGLDRYTWQFEENESYDCCVIYANANNDGTVDNFVYINLDSLTHFKRSTGLYVADNFGSYARVGNNYYMACNRQGILYREIEETDELINSYIYYNNNWVSYSSLLDAGTTGTSTTKYSLQTSYRDSLQSGQDYYFNTLQDIDVSLQNDEDVGVTVQFKIIPSIQSNLIYYFSKDYSFTYSSTTNKTSNTGYGLNINSADAQNTTFTAYIPAKSKINVLNGISFVEENTTLSDIYVSLDVEIVNVTKDSNYVSTNANTTKGLSAEIITSVKDTDIQTATSGGDYPYFVAIKNNTEQIATSVNLNIEIPMISYTSGLITCYNNLGIIEDAIYTFTTDTKYYQSVNDSSTNQQRSNYLTISLNFDNLNLKPNETFVALTGIKVASSLNTLNLKASGIFAQVSYLEGKVDSDTDLSVLGNTIITSENQSVNINLFILNQTSKDYDLMISITPVIVQNNNIETELNNVTYTSNNKWFNQFGSNNFYYKSILRAGQNSSIVTNIVLPENAVGYDKIILLNVSVDYIEHSQANSIDSYYDINNDNRILWLQGEPNSEVLAWAEIMKQKFTVYKNYEDLINNLG